ncbi:Ionotropic receptor 573 [Blattella germanica]|nr:Ionotropic receptor 573 [Blattella germanica]
MFSSFQIMNFLVLLLPTAAASFSSDVSKNMATCLVNSFQHFHKKSLVIILFDVPEDVEFQFLIYELHLREEWSVSIKSGGHIRQDSSENFFVWAPHNLNRLMNLLDELALLNSRARIIILLHNSNGIELILKKCREINMINAVLVEYPNSSSFMQAFTWLPYEPSGTCGRSDIKPIILDRCSIENGRIFDRNSSIFPSKIPFDLQGCPIKIATFPWPPFIFNSRGTRMTDKVYYNSGLEIKLVGEIAKVLNMSLQYLPPPPNDSKWGRRTDSGSWTGILGEVFHGRADLAFASLAATEDRLMHLSPSVTYWSNAVIWVVPRPQYIAGWKGMFIVFELVTWTALTIVYFIASTLIWCVAKSSHICRESAAFCKLSSCMTLTWASTLEVAVRIPNGQILKAIFICWIIYCLGVTTVYKSSLMSFLTEPHMGPPIRTFEQLLQSGLPLGYTLGLSEYFDDPRTQDSLRFCPDIDTCLNYVAFYGNSSLVSDEWYVRYLIPRLYSDRTGKPLLEILGEDVLSYHIVMIFSKGHILLERFNAIICRICESGLLEKWMHDINRNKYIDIDEELETESNWGRLTISNLQGPFLILIFGLCISSLVMFLELSSSKRFCITHFVKF